MKTLFRGSILIMAITLSLNFLKVNAETVFYTNINGVEMSESEYNTIVERTSENIVQRLTQEEFDKYVNADVADSGTIYQKVITDIDGITISQQNITEEEYNSSDFENLVCGNEINSNDYGFFETSYKRFRVYLYDFGSNDYEVYSVLTWKNVPACRSFDVFAFRLKHMSYSVPTAIQTYWIGSNYTNIYYNSSSEGYKSASNGAGFSMNLKDGNNITGFEMNMSANLAINETGYSQAHVFTTYQHAQSSLTRDQSKSYTLSAGGLGDVLYYSNTTIRNKYDDMSGIELTTPI